MEKVDLTHR